MNGFLNGLRQYADFSGRTRRQEFWMFMLFNFIFSMGTIFLDRIIFHTAYFFHIDYIYFGLLNFLYIAFFITPSWAICVRRLHDTGRGGGGWLVLLLNVIPVLLSFIAFDKIMGYSNNYIFYNSNSHYQTLIVLRWIIRIWYSIGGILLIAFCCVDSQPGENKWGENPKGIGNNVSSTPDLTTQLKTLNELKEKNIITQEMYEQESKEILNEEGNISLSTIANQPNNNSNSATQLKTLNELKTKGVITEEMYEQESKKILEKM